MTLQPQTPVNREIIEKGLDFILSHFNQRLFPRKIQTRKSDGKQIEVISKQETMKYFEESSFIDCKINAFPSYTEYKGIQRYPPDLIFIDIDENDFKGDRSFENALSRTLKNIKEKLNGIPSVNWSGNGYHILQPIECPILEQIEEFHRYKEDKFFGDNFLPSQEFLRFAEVFLSNNKADKGHFPSFKSCQIRVPGSINGKCLDNKDRRLSENIRVKTLQKWNGSRSPVTREFIEDFRTYLEQKRTDELYNSNNYKQQKKLLTNVRNKNNNCNHYRYIEKLLQTPIEEYRKRVLWRILCPYLINVRKLSYDESFQILREWLDKCNSVRKLDFNPNQKIRYELSHMKNYNPIGIQKLKTDNEELYNFLINNNKKLGIV